MRFKTLDRAALAEVGERQAAQQRSWREVPPEGVTVECCGQTFAALPKVFPPRRDTRLMIDALEGLEGKSVLDLGTGTGVLAVFAILKGANFAIAADINPDAVRNADLNVTRHGMEAQIEARLSDGFAAFGPDEAFDLILANLPGRNAEAESLVEAAQWDTGFKLHKAFFAEAPRRLKPGGRVLMTKANYPELNDVVALAEQAGLRTAVLAEQPSETDDPRNYYVLEFKAQ